MAAVQPTSRRALAERAAPPPDLEIRPKQVKAWLESLPHAPGVETAALLVRHAAALNGARIDVDHRIQILEAYEPVAHNVVDDLEAIYTKAAAPLPQRARDAVTAARRLAFELASGYRIAADDVAAKRLAFGAKKQIPLLVLRAIEWLGAELRASYKSYTPVPAGVWHELHHLYLHAEREGFAAEAADPATQSTSADAYCEALLLSLTDPYRLVPGELDRVVALARPLRPLATLGQARPATRPGAHFLVPCDTDKPPKPLLSANDDTGGPSWRLLDTNAIVDKLRLRKQAHEAGNVSQTASRTVTPEALALMGRLVTLWGDPPKRAHRRHAMETTVAICAGLKPVGHFVSAGDGGDAAKEADAIRAGITMPLPTMPDDEAAKGAPVFEWDVVNQSEGGIKVRRAGAISQPIMVGEVVGARLMGRRGWTVGAVRWITHLDDGGMEFGVQFVPGTARAAWVQPAQSASPQAKPGLLLTEEDHAQFILTLPNTYTDLRIYEVDSGSGVTTLRATRLVERTARFDLFNVVES